MSVVVPLLVVVAAFDGLVLEENVVGSLVLAVLLPARGVLEPETGLTSLLTVNVALKTVIFGQRNLYLRRSNRRCR